MGTYDIPSYLLDRANIHDIVTKMSLLLDLKKWSELGTDVFHEDVLIDYTSLLGGEPYTISGREQVKTWEKQVGGLDAWQHVTTSILIDLPQPGDDAEMQVPGKSGVLANYVVKLSRKDAKGGPFVSSGGRYELDLVRTEKEGNPWRISKLKCDLTWVERNWDVYREMEGSKL